jgi:hypothetical protein
MSIARMDTTSAATTSTTAHVPNEWPRFLAAKAYPFLRSGYRYERGDDCEALVDAERNDRVTRVELERMDVAGIAARLPPIMDGVGFARRARPERPSSR